MSTVSVVIPCYPPHFHHLPTLLERLKNQTLQPSEVIISASEMTAGQADTLSEQLNGILTCPLSITSVVEPQPPGLNRNRGGDLATSTYVAFLDADDIYHPQKLELGVLLLDRTGADILVHGFYSRGTHLTVLDQIIDVDKITITSTDTILHQTFGNPPTRIGGERGHLGDTNIISGYDIHHGMPCIRRELLNIVRYTSMRYGEDGMFLRDTLFNHRKQVIAIPEKLMIYTTC
jgi:glycosyltransferase involved in cell wall biosynthesis